MDSAAAINVDIPDLKNVVIAPEEEIEVEPEKEIYLAKFTIKDKLRETKLSFEKGQRRTVGRSGENDLWLDDHSVSKIHAALIVSDEGQLIMSDTGSTNGTFINEERIAYGKAIPVNPGDKVKFGLINVELSRVPKETDFEIQIDAEETENEISIATPAKKIDSPKHIPIAQTIIIKPEAAESKVLREETKFKTEENIGEQIKMPDEQLFENEIPAKSIYDTNVDEEEKDNSIDYELPPTEQEIVLDFDLDEK
jgi:pSer/pThr/pTyr-binding forkhead associated (FHA) protein